jgi:hypothetical protein
MIWFDAAVTLLLTLRMVLFGSTQPRLFDRKNNSSSLVGDKGQEESLTVADEEGDSLRLSEIAFRNIRISAITYSCNS